MLSQHSSTDLQPFGRMTDQGGIQFLFPSFSQADFLLVPRFYTDTFVRIAQPHIDHGVFLECAIPTIVLWTLQHHHHQHYNNNNNKAYSKKVPWHSTAILEDQATLVKVCTTWMNGIRGSPVMIEQCLQDPDNHDGYGIYHPVKLSRVHATNYSKWLDLIQQPTRVRATIDDDRIW